MVIDIQSLIDKAGGVLEFRTICDVARTTVLDWKRTGLLPASRVAQISAALDVPLEDLIKLTQAPRSRVQPQAGEAA